MSRTDLVGAVWLVKSGDRILGPFTTEEVAQKLKSKEIVVIDEVVTPMGRWRLLRDEAIFGATVEEIRKGLLTAREDTEIQGHTSNYTQTLTDPDVSVTLDAQATAVALDRSGFDSSQIKDAEFTEERIPPPVIVQNTGPLRTASVRQYGVSNEHARGAGSSLTTAAWIIAAIVLGGAAMLWMRAQSSSGSGETIVSSANYDRVLNEAAAAWNEGEFNTSLSLYRQANRLYPNRPEVVSKMAPLMIRLEGQTVQAKRAVSEALSSNPNLADRRVKSELEMGLGLAAIATDEFGEAEARFRTAISISPASFPAHFNYGVVAYLNNSFTEAARRFAGAGDEPAALLMAAKSYLKITTGTRALLRNDAEASVAKLLSRHQNFRQEALVFGAYLDLESGDKRAAAARVLAALDTDPDMTSDHWQDPFLHLVPLEWRSILPHCRKLNDELGSSTTRALLALCFHKAGDPESANRVITDSLAQAPEESFLQSVNAHILASSGRYEDAQAALRLATKADPTRLATIVRARVCTKTGNLDCAEQAWNELVSSDSPPLAALTGLAAIRSQQGDRTKALELVQRASALSPRYRPALAFKEER